MKDGEYYENGSKIQLSPRTKFSVKSIGYNKDREITSLQISDNRGVVRYELGKPYTEPSKPKTINKSEVMVLEGLIDKTNTDKKKFLDYYKVDKPESLTADQYKHAIAVLNKKNAPA